MTELKIYEDPSAWLTAARPFLAERAAEYGLQWRLACKAVRKVCVRSLIVSGNKESQLALELASGSTDSTAFSVPDTNAVNSRLRPLLTCHFCDRRL